MHICTHPVSFFIGINIGEKRYSEQLCTLIESENVSASLELSAYGKSQSHGSSGKDFHSYTAKQEEVFWLPVTPHYSYTENTAEGINIRSPFCIKMF